MCSLFSLLQNVSRPSPNAVTLVIDDLLLMPAQVSDYNDWFELRKSSYKHLTRWEAGWDEKAASRASFVKRVRLDQLHMTAKKRLPLLIHLRKDNRLIGGVSLFDIHHGNRRSASVGYWLGEPYTGRGYATKAVKGIVDYGFDALELVKVNAACQPGNVASQQVLRNCGFEREGLAKSYLKINGEWRDHELWALIMEKN